MENSQPPFCDVCSCVNSCPKHGILKISDRKAPYDETVSKSKSFGRSTHSLHLKTHTSYCNDINKFKDLFRRRNRLENPDFDHGHDPRWYTAHLARIQNTTSAVDSCHPLVSAITMTGIGRLNRKMGSSVRPEKDNAILLKQLQVIYSRRV